MILDSSIPVLYYFEKICSIPHLSCHEKELSDFVVSVARKYGHYVRQDQWHNVIVIAEASAGYEKIEPVILQGHLDMVGTKSADSNFNFLKDNLHLQLDGNILTATDTTLGADDGVAVAIMLALLSDVSLKHPRLECLFTVQEETGTDGAEMMDISDTVGTQMINLDGCGEKDITVGCYCSDKITLRKQLNPISSKKNAIMLHLYGFEAYSNNGERKHPLRVLKDALLPLREQIETIFLHCGERENMPATELDYQFVAEDNITQQLVEVLSKECKVAISLSSTNYVYPSSLNSCICSLIDEIPDGTLKTDKDDNMISTFMFAQMNINNSELRIIGSDRCRDNELNNEVKTLIKSIGEKYGCIIETSVRYISWPYQKASKLKKAYMKTMKKYWGIEPNEVLCPGGLEVTDFLSKRPQLDIISIGVSCGEFHTTSEWLDISSLMRMTQLLSHFLEDSISN